MKDRIEQLERIIPKAKANKKILPKAIECMEWELKALKAEQQIKNCSIPNVVKSLPTDECVEQWWAEGQEQNKGFWQEAPYRTNGDVVEEIKTALKYFIETRHEVIAEDISIQEFTENFANNVIEFYGTHNYEYVLKTLNEKLSPRKNLPINSKA